MMNQESWLDRDSFPIGFGLGALSPFIGIALVCFIFAFMVSQGFMDESMGGIHSKRMRTVIIVGISTNIIWIKRFNRPFTVNSLRGVTTATMIYAIAWFVMYYKDLYDE